jgi:hypothetical protein
VLPTLVFSLGAFPSRPRWRSSSWPPPRLPPRALFIPRPAPLGPGGTVHPPPRPSPGPRACPCRIPLASPGTPPCYYSSSSSRSPLSPPSCLHLRTLAAGAWGLGVPHFCNRKPSLRCYDLMFDMSLCPSSSLSRRGSWWSFASALSSSF